MVTTDHDLYARGAATLLASWEAYARGAAGAALSVSTGSRPRCSRAIPSARCTTTRCSTATSARPRAPRPSRRWTAAYRSAGVDRYAAWVHESDEGMRAELTGRGYTLEESTRAMGMALDDLSRRAPRRRARAAGLA